MAGSVGHVQFKTFTFLKKIANLFYGWGSTFLRLHYEETVYFFNTWSLGLPGAHLVNLRRKNGCVDFGPTQRF